jgi:cell division protein ZapE
MPPSDPLTLYRARLETGDLRPDPVQELAVEKLESLHHALTGYRPSTGQKGWRERFGLARRTEDPQPPQGLYLYGPVGRGKSMLMDLFASTVPVAETRRVHFHAFMRDFHAEVHAWRRTRGKDEADPIPPLADRIARECWLLCLDELEIHDIADAMIVGRLFDALFARGVVVVTTSNRHPDDLYKDGLQRDKFLPFIALIKDKLDLLELGSPNDYRLGRVRGARVFHAPLGAAARAEMDALFARMAAGAEAKPDRILLQGREIPVPMAAGDVARFSFDDLCGQPLGPGDYIQIATLYDVVILDDVPCLGPETKDKARRFVTLIDALYEHRTMLAMSAEAPPEALYPEGQGAFEFQRTVSRLTEMQAEDYLRQTHLT